MKLICSLRADQRLIIGINGNKFHAPHTGLHHPIDGVSAASADADHLDRYDILRIVVRHVEVH